MLAVLVFGACTLAVAGHLGAWLHLLWLRRGEAAPLPAPLAGGDLPRLLLQLPLYNEEDVVDELLESVGRLDWPRERLEVQVLDDSTDSTPDRVARALPALRQRGLRVDHVRRPHREGFKAGALAHGLTLSDAPLVAILDADFRPEPGWLRAAVAALLHDDGQGPVGLLQCPWGFVNPRANALTRAQALHLDAHFALEQRGRHEGGLFFGFNGTAGVWRRACIEAAGGWEGDTLTEDLDLSYRAWLAGWRLRYEDRLPVPCELPEDLPAVRAQQHRWIRGGAQVARKLLRRVWRSEQPLRRKLHATAHLLASSVFLPVLLLGLLCPLVPLWVAWGPAWSLVALGLGGLVLRAALGVLILSHLTVCLARAPGPVAGLGRFLRDFPTWLLLVTGIAVHDAHAAWLGWRGPTGTFVRTPKGRRRVAGRSLPWAAPWELAMGAWSLLGVGLAMALGQAGIVPFLLLQALAYGGLGVRSLSLRWRTGVSTSARRSIPAGV